MNKKIKIYIVLILIIGILAIGFFLNKGKQDKKFNREITEEEIEKFIPVNYVTVARATYYNDILIKKYEINESIVYLLPLQPKDNQGIVSNDFVKILLLKYNKKLDNYYKKSEYTASGNSFIKFNYDDIDNDNINELFVRSSASYGGSGTSYYLEILKISDNSIVEIARFDSNISSMPQYYNDSKEIINASYIWEENEGHFGCHYVNISKYCYDGNEFYLCDEKKSKYKYDFGDEYGIDYQRCFPFFDNFNEFLENEDYH